MSTWSVAAEPIFDKEEAGCSTIIVVVLKEKLNGGWKVFVICSYILLSGEEKKTLVHFVDLDRSWAGVSSHFRSRLLFKELSMIDLSAQTDLRKEGTQMIRSLVCESSYRGAQWNVCRNYTIDLVIGLSCDQRSSGFYCLCECSRSEGKPLSSPICLCSSRVANTPRLPSLSLRSSLTLLRWRSEMNEVMTKAALMVQVWQPF